MFMRMIFPRRALERGVGGWGTKGEPLGTLLSPISCRVTRNGHTKILLSCLRFFETKEMNRKITIEKASNHFGWSFFNYIIKLKK